MAYLLAIIFSFIFIPRAYPAGQFEVIKDNINIRVDSTVTSLSLGYLNKGEHLRVVEEKFGWAKVILPERFSCYAAAKYIEKIEKKRGKVIAAKLNLRSEPNLNAPVLGKAGKGDILDIIKEGVEWHKVRAYPNLRGWVHMKFLQKVEEEELLTDFLSTTGLNKIIWQLNEADMDKKKIAHRQLIQMGEKIIPQLESYLNGADKNTAYSLIYVMGEIGKKNNKLAGEFLSKVDGSSLILGAAYLDIVQNIIQPENPIPYFYLAAQGKLKKDDIKKTKKRMQKIYQKYLKKRNKSK